ncbi:MAG: lysophospholipid acyltransferase family protein [Planctomycetes bacterium]|nr:lysophospholipid acyltransferase family protein [Planctomycetota bacterium]
MIQRATQPNDPTAAPALDSTQRRAGAEPPRENPNSDKIGWFARAKFGVVRWFLWMCVRAFSLKGIYLVGRFFGTCEYLINFKRRARYRAELWRVFPAGLSRWREQTIIRSYFRRTRCDKMLYLVFDRLPKDKILKRIRFHGKEHLDAALVRGQGVYVLLSHTGSHHVAGLLMALLGYKCAGIRDRNEGVLRVFVQQKYAETFPEFAAVKVLYADSFPRDIYRCFRENRVVGSALDVGRVRGLQLKTCPVRIFGQTREFLTGTLQIALRCNAAVVQGFVVSRPNFYFRLIVNPPLHVSTVAGGEGDDNPELVAGLMQKYADGIEQHVREHPDHISRV